MRDEGHERKPRGRPVNTALTPFCDPFACASPHTRRVVRGNKRLGRPQMLALLKRFFGSKELPEDLSYGEARAVLESHKGQLERELASRFDAEPEMLYYLAE